MTDIIIGKYKIETHSGVYGTVRKALGPWPLKNWSWIEFYYGTVDQCRSYIEWAERIDRKDQDLIKHATLWYTELYQSIRPVESFTGDFSENAIHFPKTMRYNFQEALELYPKK